MDLAITHVPLRNLTLSPKNVRKVDPGQQAHDELCALISAAGLIYPLCVEPASANDDHYEVVEGGRRLRALHDLAEKGELEPDYAVPCRIVPPGIDPEELSIMGNSHEPMHTADQVTAFAKLAADGMAIPTIAQRFGVTERTVEKRLRLANIAPVVLDAYRAGEMNLETLEAFAVTSDQAQQARVWDSVKSHYSPYGSRARSVRHFLTEDRIASTHPLARYATKRAYLKAGGRISEDLFAGEHDTEIWYDDPDIVRQVATTRLERAADKLAGEWAWTETHLDDPGYSYVQQFATLKPQPTPEEQTRLDEITARLNTLFATGAELSDEEETEYRSLEDEATSVRDAIRQRPLSDEAKKRSGIILALDYNGRVTYHTGLVRPEDVPADPDPDAPETIEDPRVDRPVRGAKYYSDSHAEMLRSFRGAEVQAALSGNFRVTFDIFTFQSAYALVHDDVALMRGDVGTNAVLRKYLYARKPLDTVVSTAHVAPGLANDPAAVEAITEQHERLGAARAALNLSWADHKDPDLAYRAFCKLKPKEKQAIFAYCMARSARLQLSFDSDSTTPLEVAIEQLGTSPHTSFRPRAETFWKRLKKGQILDIADSVIGSTWTDKHRKAKKSDLVVVMEQVFADPASDPDIPAQAHETIHAWSIPGFAPFGPDPVANDTDDAPNTGADPERADPAEPATDTEGAPAETLPEFLDD